MYYEGLSASPFVTARWRPSYLYVKAPAHNMWQFFAALGRRVVSLSLKLCWNICGLIAWTEPPLYFATRFWPKGNVRCAIARHLWTSERFPMNPLFAPEI
jgi:hypothetical protein